MMMENRTILSQKEPANKKTEEIWEVQGKLKGKTEKKLQANNKRNILIKSKILDLLIDLGFKDRKNSPNALNKNPYKTWSGPDL